MTCMARSLFIAAVTSTYWHTRRADLDILVGAVSIWMNNIIPQGKVVIV